MYPYSSNNDPSYNYNAYKNLKTNIYGYGDAILETSSAGNSSSNSWNNDYSWYAFTDYPFFVRGGGYDNSSAAGIFAFYDTVGRPFYSYGFRAVLIGIE